MSLHIALVQLEHILSLRTLFLHETNAQIRYHACHERGWSDSYLVSFHGHKIGYGSVKGAASLEDRDTVFEFYLLPPFRHLSSVAFQQLLAVAKARFVECQSNEPFLTGLLYQTCQQIRADVCLFGDRSTTFFQKEGVVFRKRQEADIVFEHTREPVGEYVLESNGEIVASGGFALHYNMPFADLYMEVKATHQGKGLGSLLVQELKRACYLEGRVPAARCSIDNAASRATLQKAGLTIVGYMLQGSVKQ